MKKAQIRSNWKTTSNSPQVCEIQLSYCPLINAVERQKISVAADAHHILLQNWDQRKLQFIEQFKMILLNNANQVLGIMELSTGGTLSTTVDVKLIFAAALLTNAHKIILAHNHPSGSLQPSKTDLEMTSKIIEAGRLLEIKVIDHLILAEDKYFSMADQGHI